LAIGCWRLADFAGRLQPIFFLRRFIRIKKFFHKEHEGPRIFV
jgi:hypothetical protein